MLDKNGAYKNSMHRFCHYSDIFDTERALFVLNAIGYSFANINKTRVRIK